MIGIGLMEILLFFIVLLLWAFTLNDIIRGGLDRNSKIIWSVVVILMPILGPLIYFLAGRKSASPQ